MLTQKKKAPKVSTLHKELQQLRKGESGGDSLLGKSTPAGDSVPNGQT